VDRAVLTMRTIRERTNIIQKIACRTDPITLTAAVDPAWSNARKLVMP
jgi:hypothetical protein